VEKMVASRKSPLWLGAGLTVAWMVALRYFLGVFLISPVISWGLILLTVVGCIGAGEESERRGRG